MATAYRPRKSFCCLQLRKPIRDACRLRGDRRRGVWRYFESLDNVKAFVGEDYEQAYVPDEAKAILSRFDERSQHYEVREQRSYGAATHAAADAVSQQAATSLPSNEPVLKPDVWFVRSNKGSGSFPVTREGFGVVRNFIFALLGAGAMAIAMVAVGKLWGPSWLTMAWIPFYVAIAILSAWYFIAVARKHTDTSITYNDYLKARRNA